MLIRCTPCNGEHNFNARESRWALLAIMSGDAQRMTKDGVVSLCLEDAMKLGYAAEVSETDVSAIAV